MGRLTGFFSGLTLTSGALYVALLAHQRNRVVQSTVLQQQAQILQAVVEPERVPIDTSPRFQAQHVSWSETWKDRWNAEVESLVRRCQQIEWDDVRAAVEGRVKEWREGGDEKA